MLHVGDPRLIGRRVLQLLIAFHLEIAEVHLLQPRQLLMGHGAVDGLQRLLRPQQAAGVVPGGPGIGRCVFVQGRQGFRQGGDIRRPVIQVPQAALRLGMAQQGQLHFSTSVSPQNIRYT